MLEGHLFFTLWTPSSLVLLPAFLAQEPQVAGGVLGFGENVHQGAVW